MSDTINERDFDFEAEKMLLHLETCLTELDDSMDVELSMGVLSIEFESGRKFVINSHRAARQIWMSAYSTAWHFDYDGEFWHASKTDVELLAVVNEQVGKVLGRAVSIAMN
jgi:CyaY protein